MGESEARWQRIEDAQSDHSLRTATPPPLQADRNERGDRFGKGDGDQIKNDQGKGKGDKGKGKAKVKGSGEMNNSEARWQRVQPDDNQSEPTDRGADNSKYDTEFGKTEHGKG